VKIWLTEWEKIFASYSECIKKIIQSIDGQLAEEFSNEEV
jgi:hypothetical protein